MKRAALRPDPMSLTTMADKALPPRPATEAAGLTREEIRQIVLEILG
jgi:hypothetical protein